MIPRERDEDDRSESSDRWLVSYADFITLLFAFFVILYATSERNAEKTEEFQESVKKYLIKTGAFGGSGEKISQGEKYNSPIEPPISTYKQNDEKISEVQNQLEAFVEQNFREEQKRGMILDISSEELGVRVSLSAPFLFAAGSAQFKASALSTLQKLGSFVAKLGHRLLIEGHAAAKGSFTSAWEMASMEATTTVRYLQKVHHIDGEKMMAVSRGAEHPLVPESSAGASEKNNRLDILILSEDAPL